MLLLLLGPARKLNRLGGMGLYTGPLFSWASFKCRDLWNKCPIKELNRWLNMSALQLQVLPYHPSMKLVALMGWVEGPFSTLIGSDQEFLEASENARAQPTTNHLTSDTTVLPTVPTHVRAYTARGFCSCHGTYLPKSTSSSFFVHAKFQIPPNLLNTE
jgi:hypothetical protein